MSGRKKLISEQVIPEVALGENSKTLEFYKTYKEISDILEKISIAMGRKQIYRCFSSSTENCKINRHAISSTTKPYKI